MSSEQAKKARGEGSEEMGYKGLSLLYARPNRREQARLTTQVLERFQQGQRRLVKHSRTEVFKGGNSSVASERGEGDLLGGRGRGRGGLLVGEDWGRPRG